MATYKHQGLSDGKVVFEWCSDVQDPAASNPYPGKYQNLTFATTSPNADELALFTKSKTTEASILEKKNAMVVLTTLKGKKDKTAKDIDDILEALIVIGVN